MSTISSVSHPALGHVAPIAVDSPTVSGRFAQSLAVAQAPQSWLTTAETSQTHRPNVKAFMDRTGATFLDASELVYGVVGSNTDVRDWSAIMASDDPISAARQATGQMYGRTDITPRTDATYMGANDTVAQEGHFAVRLLKDEHNKVLDQGLKLIDAQGLLLRDAGNTPETIARNAWLFGFDTQPLAKLAPAAATVSADLGRAVLQATAMGTPQHLAAATGFAAPATTEPVVTAQKDIQASSPSLAQALQDAAAKALSHMDSATYLGSLFRVS